MSHTPSVYSEQIAPRRFNFQEGCLIGGRYRVQKHLGGGSFGDVYKVEDISGKSYALKLLRLWDVPPSTRKSLVDRFEMEFKTGQIDSPYLVHSFFYDFLEGNPYFVMDFCKGGDLSSRIGRIVDELPKIAREILYGLDALHKNGKVHRDLKPENVLINDKGAAVLTDFGISGDRNNRITVRNLLGKPSQIFGTYAYMPPEQANKDRNGGTVLPTTDIFSFGVVLYQLITGRLPFGELNGLADLSSYQKRGKEGDWSRTTLMNCPHGSSWLSLIEGCLVPNYRDRIQNVAAALPKVPSYGRVVSPVAPVVARKTFGTVPVLRITQGKDYGNEYLLTEIIEKYHRKYITVGRGETNMICLREYDEPYISRRHFTLEKVDDGNWYIRDGQWNPEAREWETSFNGTFLNSDEVTVNGHLLAAGDVISAGEVKLIFDKR